MLHTTGATTPAERFAQKERSELREFNKTFFTSIREEIRKVDRCGLIRVENKLYQLPKEYADKKIIFQITDTEIIFHNADNKIIRMDKATSIYTTKLQEKSIIKTTNDISPDYDVWGNNSLSRSLDEYSKFIGGIW